MDTSFPFSNISVKASSDSISSSSKATDGELSFSTMTNSIFSFLAIHLFTQRLGSEVRSEGKHEG